jgi:NAD(P)-dependent dehydrogenase (short-subunit alcohol dehydrogenase family)
MSLRFDGRVAIVTGSGTGLGRSHALALAARGAKVVVADMAGAETVAEEIRAAGGEALAAAVDVTNVAAVDAMVATIMDTWGRIDILINNAGILRDKSFAKLPIDDFRLVVEVHLMGAATCSKAVWPIMREQNYGRILMTTSTSGVYGNFGQSNYGAAKAGQVGLMNVLHLEGAKYGIAVNALAPTAATRMTADLFDAESLAALKPEYVTPAALFLVSENAPSRTVLLAGAGTYARMAIIESEGVFLPEDERTPEAVAAAFDRIADMSSPSEFESGPQHVDRILSRAAAARRAG